MYARHAGCLAPIFQGPHVLEVVITIAQGPLDLPNSPKASMCVMCQAFAEGNI